MTIETQVKAVERMVEEMLAEDPQYFLVEVRIRPTNNVKVFVDGDKGISIGQCAAYNRELYKKLDAASLFADGDFSLEFSSPGLDEPLKLFRQYRKNVGRKVEVTLKDGNRVDGLLKDADESGISLEETRGRNKKKEIIQHRISLEDIKSTKI